MEPDNEANNTLTTNTGPPRTFVERWLATLFEDRFLRRIVPIPHPTPDITVQTASSNNNPSGARHSHLHPTRYTATAAARLLPLFTAASTVPGMAEARVQFCVEDTVGLKDDKYMVGVVDRSFGDVDSHEPRPQRDYTDDIERHTDVPREQFSKFLRTGIPPRGTVLVSWQTQFRTELIPEAQLELLDRALYVGDVVKRDAKSPMSGTVIGTKAYCTLFPALQFNGGQVTQSLSEDLSIRVVPATELVNAHEYVEGALVIYGDWIGKIEQVVDEVAVKLSNNSVVIAESVDELDPDDPLIERLSVGDTVKTKKGNLRRGRWRYGAFDPTVRPHGVVVETRTVRIVVHWLTKRFRPVSSDEMATRDPQLMPPEELGLDEMESPRFHIYDATAGASSTLPLLENGVDRSYHVAEVAVGDRVRFKDIAGAAVKYDGTHTLPNGYAQGKLTRIARTESLGYDLNVYIVMQTHTIVTVQWQDLSITEDASPFLLPDPNVEDDDEVWPGEIVCTKEQREEKSPDGFWTFEPARVGVVQGVKSHDRIATVRWFENADIRFMGDDLIPPSSTGTLCDGSEDVSLYDIRSTPSVTRRRGDFVIIHTVEKDEMEDADAHPAPNPNDLDVDWFGEIIDLGLDGLVTVRLGAAKPVQDVRIPAERVRLVYSSDMASQFDLMPTLDGDSIEESDDGASDLDSFNEMWVEYEGVDGETMIGNYDDEDWSTEDEDEDTDDDLSMPDLEPQDDIDTSKTTPEAQPDGERKSPRDTETDQSDRLVPMPSSFSPIVEDSPMSIPAPVIFTADAESEHLPSFVVLDTPPPANHHYLDTQPSASSSSLMKRIAKEHKILRSSLPPSIFFRTWESRLDLIRVLMIGPHDTPYEYAPFVIDFHLPSNYPSGPPEAFFHSWTNGNGPVNPNLYEDGKICLSLLGTWHADERNESWSPAKSTLLQVLVSIMGLVLVKEPYYNEAGYDVHREAPETKLSSALYTERAYFRARAFIVHALTNTPAIDPFKSELEYLYLSFREGAPGLLDKAIAAANEILHKSEGGGDEERDGLRRISLGAVVMLKRQVDKLQEISSFGRRNLWEEEQRRRHSKATSMSG
jgi:ubiquitin-conjugating enzyme E2 O